MVGAFCIELIHVWVQWKFGVKWEQGVCLLFVANGLVFLGGEGVVDILWAAGEWLLPL
jgi:hypothetical protein